MRIKTKTQLIVYINYSLLFHYLRCHNFTILRNFCPLRQVLQISLSFISGTSQITHQLFNKKSIKWHFLPQDSKSPSLKIILLLPIKNDYMILNRNQDSYWNICLKADGKISIIISTLLFSLWDIIQMLTS